MDLRKPVGYKQNPNHFYTFKKLSSTMAVTDYTFKCVKQCSNTWTMD